MKVTAAKKEKKLVFHIGHHKAGSTTIQNSLATKGLVLKNHRLLYPAAMAHNYLTGEFTKYARHGQVTKNSGHNPSLGEIAKKLSRIDYDVAVFSGESFEGVKPEVFNKAFQDFFVPYVQDYLVLCYVRPHAARLLSSFAEQTKLGVFNGTLSEFRRRAGSDRRYIFAPKLLAWKDQFNEKFVVRPMVRDVLLNSSLLDDFVQTAFGPDVTAEIKKTSADNESLSVEDLALLRHLQGRLVGVERNLRHAMGWEFHLSCGEIPASKKGTRLALDKANAELIRETYIDDARELDRIFFSESPVMVRELDRAVDTAIDKPQSLEVSDHFSPEAVRAIDLYANIAHELLDEDTGRVHRKLVQKRIRRLHGGAEPAEKRKSRKSFGGRRRDPLSPSSQFLRRVKSLLHRVWRR